MGLDQYKEQVGGIQLFQALDGRVGEVSRAILLEIAEESRLADGDVLYDIGAEGSNTGALLVEGSVEVDRDEGGVIIVDAPDLLGEMQQFDPAGQRGATVRAAGAAVVLEFSWHEFVSVAVELMSREEQLALRAAMAEHVGHRLGDAPSLGDDAAG